MLLRINYTFVCYQNPIQYMNYNNLLTQLNEGVLLVTINRPDKLNALNKQTISELSEILGAAEQNDDVRVIIITGSGEKAFVAGADISEFAHFKVEEGKRLSAEGHSILFNKVERLKKPVIAAINGYALGGGLELAMSAHIRIASDSARLGLPEVSLGVIPGYGGTQRLAQLIGRGRAFELIMTAGMIDGATAKEYGLVNHVVPAGQLIEKCSEIAQKILRNSPTAIAAAIRAVNANYRYDADGLQVEIDEFGNCFGTADFIEGTTAFIEKRKPKFLGK
jgi:enoyl-CoA hydratase